MATLPTTMDVAALTNSNYDVVVRNGFFWLDPDGQPSIELYTDTALITGNAFMSKPRWWQVVEWYRAVRLWLSGPQA